MTSEHVRIRRSALEAAIAYARTSAEKDVAEAQNEANPYWKGFEIGCAVGLRTMADYVANAISDAEVFDQEAVTA
jgi:hypothetical protein